jgi:hypothetical protein
MAKHFLVPVEDFLEAQTVPVRKLEYSCMIRGSSLIIPGDYMFHQYGSDEHWDRYAKVTGDPGWAQNNVKNYITKVPHLHVLPSSLYTK